MRPSTAQGAGPSHTTIGITDLMTSLAIVFILLFAAQSELQENKEAVEAAIRDHIRRFGLSLDADPRDPLALLIVVPENLLIFEFGKGTLSPTAVQFLLESLPFYVGALCGPLRDKIDSFAIEGHTDDGGGDVFNLKLSQERSLALDGEGAGGHSSRRAGFVPVFSRTHISDRPRQTRRAVWILSRRGP